MDVHLYTSSALTVEARARMLVAHEESGYRDGGELGTVWPRPRSVGTRALAQRGILVGRCGQRDRTPLVDDRREIDDQRRRVRCKSPPRRRDRVWTRLGPSTGREHPTGRGRLHVGDLHVRDRLAARGPRSACFAGERRGSPARVSMREAPPAARAALGPQRVSRGSVSGERQYRCRWIRKQPVCARSSKQHRSNPIEQRGVLKGRAYRGRRQASECGDNPVWNRLSCIGGRNEGPAILV